MGSEHICRLNKSGRFFDLVWILLQRMATRSKSIILTKSEVLSDRIGVFTQQWETRLATFQTHNPYFCLFMLSSGLWSQVTCRGWGEFLVLILGSVMVVCPLARRPHSVVPLVRVRLVLTSAPSQPKELSFTPFWLGTSLNQRIAPLFRSALLRNRVKLSPFFPTPY